MKFEEFEVYAKSGNVIPVYEKIVADLETPVSVLARFCNDENLFLLESVEAGERFGRYSFIGINPQRIFEVKKGGSIMDLRREFAALKPVVLPELPPLTGGAVGYMDYETVNEFELLPQPKQPGNQITSRFMICDQMIVFDNLKHLMYIIISVKTEEYENLRSAYDDAQVKIAAIRARLATAPVIPEIKSNISKLTPNISHNDFINMVEKAKKYIYDGEIIQVVLSQKFIASSYLPTLQIYRALRMVNPSPYTFFMKIGTK
ncbi:MAG: chorismate-binding protein, partial [Victivallaceae bacterium]